MPLNIHRARQLLEKFDFTTLFTEEMGWSPPPNRTPIHGKAGELEYSRTPVAELSGVVVFTVTTPEGAIPGAKARAAIHKQVAEQSYENLLVFTDAALTQSLWYWVKRENKKSHPRDHHYFKGQPGDLFLGKLASIVVDISALDEEGNISVTEVAGRLKSALDVERTTKKFFRDYDGLRLDFLDYLGDIADDRMRRWYASVILNRLMFIWFLQKKGFLDGGNINYLSDKLELSKRLGANEYFSKFLRCLFFEGFAKPPAARSREARRLLGNICYLNGGLFLPHKIEQEYGYDANLARPSRLNILDEAFDKIFVLFSRYSWHLDDRPGQQDNEINPDVLGYIFEKYINQKEFGAYYTRPEITHYLCEQTIHRLILDRIYASPEFTGNKTRFSAIGDLLMKLDAPLCRRVLDILPKLKLLDPACGSGAFLVAAMRILLNIYCAVETRIRSLNHPLLNEWLHGVLVEHKSLHYYYKKCIITDNLFGVDIMGEATEIARLRLFLALVSSAHAEDQLEPLPNIDFNILAGNSLVGLLQLDAAKFDAGAAETETKPRVQARMTFRHASELGFDIETPVAPTAKEAVKENQDAHVARDNSRRLQAILADKNQAVEQYKKHAFLPGIKDDLHQDERVLQLRGHIEKVREESYRRMNGMFLREFQALGIKLEEATWDESKNKEGRPVKSPLKPADMAALEPFHWGYDFDAVLGNGGFDAIITNPPWEIFKPNAKEFFEHHSEKDDHP